jgi:hypothetical protein
MMRAISGWALALAAAFLVACGDAGPMAPSEPPGLLMVARTPDLARLLDRLGSLEGTPLAHGARELAEGLPGCGLIEARAPDAGLEALKESLVCAPPRSALARLHQDLGSASIAFVTPEREGLRVRGRIHFDALDQAEVELTIPNALARGAAAMLLPGREAPGPGVLSGTETLLHARLRPEGGLDLSSLVPDDSQGDRMFRLKSRLFAGAVLDGTWEAAIYLPTPGSTMPRATLALGTRAQAPAAAAAGEFISQLEETWSIRRAPFAIAGAPGACLPELRILPDFAPCYVATGDALVVGWNAESVAKALDGGGSGLGLGGGVLVELARFPEADERMARAGGIPRETLAPHPWGRLQAVGHRSEDAVELRLHLAAKGGA